MSKRDYYEILGVGKGASEEEMKKAFRNKAKQLHPDRNMDNPDAEKNFKELNEAYDVLKDPQKRAAYDQMGHAAFDGSGGFGHGGGADFSNFGDVFEDLFGEFLGGRRARGGGGGSGRARGADMRYNIAVTLEEAFAGKKVNITVPGVTKCDPCDGSGAEKGSQPVTCPTCRGRGTIRAQSGFFTIERTCHTCNGSGKIIKNPCKKCGGSGTLNKEKNLEINIPAGVETGTRIRVTGEGAAGERGGPPGDLYIFVEVKEHVIFSRDEADLHCRVPISFCAAALGDKIDVPTIDGGKVRVSVPEGAQTGKQFRIRDKGMPFLRDNRRGDLYIEIFVETPVNLTKRQKELLEEFKRDEAENNPEGAGFFSKVKDIFGW